MKRCFSDKEIKILKANPYTYRVSAERIRFTAEFKEMFWAKYCSGMTAASAIYELGYDPDMLGAERIHGIIRHIRKEANSEIGFHTGNAYPKKKKIPFKEEPISPNQTIVRLKNEVLYLRQEMEFLKKIIDSGRDRKQRK